MLARQRQRRAQEGSPQTIQVFLRTRIKLAYSLPIPWASNTIKIMVDPISMIKTLREAMVAILTPIVLMVVGIPGYCSTGHTYPRILQGFQGQGTLHPS